jgi:hypothetical protein
MSSPSFNDRIQFDPARAESLFETATGLNRDWLAANILSELPLEFEMRIRAMDLSHIALDLTAWADNGFATLDARIYPREKSLYIETLIVDGDIQSKGIAGTIVRGLGMLSRDTEIDTMLVHGSCENGASFWPSFGFFYKEPKDILKSLRRNIDKIGPSLPKNLLRQIWQHLDKGTAESICHVARANEPVNGTPLNRHLFHDLGGHCYLDLNDPVQSRMLGDKIGLDMTAPA